MAKKAILDVLESTIGKYVRNLDAESLNVAVWKGKIELNSLELDIDSINAELDRQAAESPNLALPFKVVSGGFGNFQVDVPWSRITSQPVVLRANGLSVVVEPFDRVSNADHLAVDEETEGRRIHNINAQREQSLKAHDEYRQRANALRKLAAGDMLQSDTEGEAGEQQSAGFTEKLVRRIVENLQVDINDVHITLKESSSSAGVVLGSLSLFTTGEDGQRRFIDRTRSGTSAEKSFLFKVLQIDGLGVYLDEASSPFSRKSRLEVDHDFILAPLSFESRLRQSDSTKCVEFPKYLLKSELSHLSILLSRTQLELGNKIALSMSPSMNAARPLFPEYRPLTRISTESAKDWWMYAFRCVGRLNRRRSWVEFFRGFQKRKLYIPIYKRNAHAANCSWLKPLTEDELAQLNQLERDRSVSMEGIMAWRTIADAQMEREQLKFDATMNKKKREAGGIMASFFGTTNVEQTSDEDDPPISLTIEEMQELEAISLEQTSESHLSDDSKLCDFAFVLGSFKVNLVGHNLRQVAALDMGTVSTSFDANADGSYVFNLKLLSLEVHDKVTPKSVFPTVLRNIGKRDEAAFKVSLRKAKNGDQQVFLRLVAFETIASPLLITEVKRFFSLSNKNRPGSAGLHKNPILRESLSGTVDLFYDADPGEPSAIGLDLPNANSSPTEAVSDKITSAMLDAWKSKTEQKKKWTIDCDLQAPLLVVPETCTSPLASVLVFNLGRLQLRYGPDESSTSVTGWFDAQQQLGKKYHTFDLGSLNFSELNFSIGTAGSTFWRKGEVGTSSDSTGTAIIEPLSASLDVGVESQLLAPRICAFGEIPSIGISVSPDQISNILAVYSGWKPTLREFLGRSGAEGPLLGDEAGVGITILDEGHDSNERESNVGDSPPPRIFSVRGSPVAVHGESTQSWEQPFASTHLELSLKRFSIQVKGEKGEGVEAHLVAVSASALQKSDGSLYVRLCMGWFWILDKLVYETPRRQRLIAHSNLPRSADYFAEGEVYDIMGELQRLGIFDDGHKGSSELANISIAIKGDELTDPTYNIFSKDLKEVDANVSVVANLSSLYLHWNPRAVKSITRSFSRSVAAIDEAYRSSPAFLETSPRRFSVATPGLPREKERIAVEADDASFLTVKATMKSMQICLDSARDDEPLFTLTMVDAQCNLLSLQDNYRSMKTALELGDVRIEGHPTTRTHNSYKTILGLAPGHSASLLSIQYFAGPAAVQSFAAGHADVSRCNACARVELSPMRFVHIQAQVLTLVEYITEGVLGALAAKAASSAAGAAVEIAHMEGGENFFAIRATGFEFVLPQSASATEHLSLHTGGLDIDFRGFPHPGGSEVQLKLSEVSVQDHKGVQMVNEAIAMSVDIDMPPEGVGSKDKQAMRIGIEIVEAPFRLSHPQYQQIMWTLQQNIGEPDPCLRESPMRDDGEADFQDSPDFNGIEAVSDENSPVTHGGVELVEKENRIYIDFRVDVLSMEICGEDESEPIALVRADQSSISFRMVPDENLFTSEATLRNLSCEDRRPGFHTRPFRSLIHQADRYTELEKDVFYVSYRNVDQKASVVELRIGSPQIIFIPDVVAEVLQFLSLDRRGDFEQTDGELVQLRGRVEQQTHESVDVEAESNLESIEATLVSFVEGSEMQDSTNMAITMVSADCSIVLIDVGASSSSVRGVSGSSLFSAKSPVAETLVLRGNFNAKTNFSNEAGSGRMIAANVELHGENMEIFTAFGHEFTSPIQVLEPTNISCFLNLSPRDDNTKELQIRAVTLSPVLLTFSMQNAALVNAIFSGVLESFGSEPTEQPRGESLHPMNESQTRRISQLATALDANIEVESDGGLMDQESRSISDASSSNATNPVGAVFSSIVTRVNFTFPDASLTVINDLQGLDEALFRITAKNFVAGAEIVQDMVSSLGGDVIQTTFDSSVNMSLVADYFDSSVGLWKVLLRRPWELTLKSTRGKSRRFKGDRLSTTVDLESFPCHISFSERFLVSLAAASQMWSIYSMASDKATERVPKHIAEKPRKSLAASAARKLITSLPYAIENHSGADVTFMINEDRSCRWSCPSGVVRYFRFKLPTGEGYGGQRLYGQDVTQMKCLTIYVGDRAMKIDHIDAELSRPRQAHLLDRGRYLLSHVAKEGKATVLHLSSPVDMFNRSSIPFRVAVVASGTAYDVGICGEHQSRSTVRGANIPSFDTDESDGSFSIPSSKFGLPVDLLAALTDPVTDQSGICAVLRVNPCLDQEMALEGDLVIPSLGHVAKETSIAGGHLLRRFEVTFRAPKENYLEDPRIAVPDPFVAQVCLIQSLVDRKFPFLQIYFEPRIVIENRIPVGIRIRTPMPHTFMREDSGRRQSGSEIGSDQNRPEQVVHELSTQEAIEVFTPGPSIAISISCSDHPVAGRKTSWMEGGWVDIPLVHDYRLPEPLRCVFPFIEQKVDDEYSSPRSADDGSDFVIAEADQNLAKLIFGEDSAGQGSRSAPERDSIEVVASNTDSECRRIVITVFNYGLDHTGGILFEKSPQTHERRKSVALETPLESTPSPISAFSSRNQQRISLLPEGKSMITLLHLTMESTEGFRRSQRFRLEDVVAGEGGIDCSAIRWEDNTESGYFAYRRLVNAYQFQLHIIPEYVVFNGSEDYRVGLRQDDGCELMIGQGKVVPVRSSQELGLTIALNYMAFGGRTAPIRVDSLGFRVSVIKDSEGGLLGTVAIQTIIGNENSRLVVKLGEVMFGDSMVTHGTIAAEARGSKGMMSKDILRLRVRWSELKVTLNETRPLNVDDERNIAFVETALDHLVDTNSGTEFFFKRKRSPRGWMEARQEYFEEQQEIEKHTQRPTCTVVFRRFTIDWQRIFKAGSASLPDSRTSLQSTERSQFSMIVHEVQVLDCAPDSEFPVVFESGPGVSFFDLCVRTRGPLDSDVVKVDLFDLNLAHLDGKSEKITIRTSEEFVWKFIDLTDRIIVAIAGLAGVELTLDWDEVQGGYVATATDVVPNSSNEDTLMYTPPKSDRLFVINRARVSPFVAIVTFKRKPQAARYSLAKGNKMANVMNYFTTQLKFTIDRAELRFARYDASNIKGPSDRLIEMLGAVYMSRMKLKVVSLMTAATFQDWKNLASRETGDDEFVEGDILRATGHVAGRTVGYVFKKVGRGLGSGVSNVASTIGNEIENATEKVGARAVGAGVNSVVTGLGTGVGSTVIGVGDGAGKVLKGAGKGVGQVFGGVTGGVVIAGKGIGKGITTGDGKAVASGLVDGVASVGTGVGRGVESAVMGAADGVLSCGQGIFSGMKSVGKGVAGAFTGGKKPHKGRPPHPP